MNQLSSEGLHAHTLVSRIGNDEGGAHSFISAGRNANKERGVVGDRLRNDGRLVGTLSVTSTASGTDRPSDGKPETYRSVLRQSREDLGTRIESADKSAHSILTWLAIQACVLYSLSIILREHL